MSTIFYKLSAERSLALFARLIFCLLVFQLALQTPAQRLSNLTASAAKNTAQIQIQIPSPKDPVTVLSKIGPVFLKSFSMSNFSMLGFVKDQSPIVIEYELEPGSTATITISSMEKDKNQTFVIELPTTNDQRQQIIRRLPEGFGKKPQVGVLSFRAFKNGSGERKPARFFLSGLGVGDKAVGSMVIDQLQFRPGSINTKLKEKASYSFRSTSDFNTGSADFMLVTLSSDGVVRSELAGREMLKNGVRGGASVTKEWNGRNIKGKISQGPHQFWVRVWRGAKSGGDWVFAATRQMVIVQ